ncbi:proteasome assembly chaperone family protein [Stetteria hydrogenophila]
MIGGFYEEEINGFLFREYGELGRPKYLVLGLPDVGLVGAIAAMHIIRERKLKDAVGIESYTFLPPVAVVANGRPLHPVRIYTDGEELAVLITDVPVAPAGVAPLGSAIVEYARSRGFEVIISLTGVGSPARMRGAEPKVYWVSTGSRAEELGSRLGAEKFENGIIVGPYAIVLKESVRRKVNNLVVLAESYIDFPDPEAAAAALQALGKATGLEVSVEKLLEEAEQLRLRLRQLMKETREAMSRLGKPMEYRAPLVYT